MGENGEMIVNFKPERRKEAESRRAFAKANNERIARDYGTESLEQQMQQILNEDAPQSEEEANARAEEQIRATKESGENQRKISSMEKNGIRIAKPMTNHYANAETIRAANREVKQQENRIRKIARENRSVAQSIRAWLDRVLAKLGNTDAQERVELQRVRDLYAQALGESRNINAGQSVVGGNLYSRSAVDNEENAEYNETGNDEKGGIRNVRQMGDGIRGRLSEQMHGEQSADYFRERRKSQEDVSGERRGAGNFGRVVFDKDSEGRRLTEEQAKKIKGTAVRDAYGNPLVVYHYTPDMTFKTFKIGDIGFHFGTFDQVLQRKDDKSAKGGRVYRAYLNIKNPYRVRLDLNAWYTPHIGLYLWSEGILTDEQWSELNKHDGIGYESDGAKMLREMLYEKGIDGFVYSNKVEGDADSYIALRDDQIVRTYTFPVTTVSDFLTKEERYALKEIMKRYNSMGEEESQRIPNKINKTADGELSEKEDSRNRRFSISETDEEMTQEDMDDGTDIDIPSDVIPADVLFYPKKEEISEEQRRAFAKANDERIARDYGTESLEQEMMRILNEDAPQSEEEANARAEEQIRATKESGESQRKISSMEKNGIRIAKPMTNNYANAETIREANREVKRQEKRIREIAREYEIAPKERELARLVENGTLDIEDGDLGENVGKNKIRVLANFLFQISFSGFSKSRHIAPL